VGVWAHGKLNTPTAWHAHSFPAGVPLHCSLQHSLQFAVWDSGGRHAARCVSSTRSRCQGFRATRTRRQRALATAGSSRMQAGKGRALCTH
jgi:hypothetical protein